MSVNRSWDIQPSRPVARPPARPAKKEVTPRAPQKVSRPEPAQKVPTRREAVRRAPRERSSVSLRDRRRGKRRRLIVGALVVLLVLIVGVLVLLWQPFLRVHTVQADGPGSEEIPAFVKKELAGTTYGIIPRDSIFFLSQDTLRDSLLRAFPSIQAVSLKPAGLTTLTVTTIGRATAFWWCGESHAVPGACFETDPEGKLFALVPADQLSASSSVLILYSALNEGSTSEPLGATVAHAERLPALLQFVKALKGLTANVVRVELRADEADLYTPRDTRITYVLGREEQAAALAATAFPSLALNDGSLLYVDLRFDSKVFFKKKTEGSK